MRLVGDVMTELGFDQLWETQDVARQILELFDADVDCLKLTEIRDGVIEKHSAWRSKQVEKHSQNQDLQEQVALAERKLVSAKMESPNNEELQRVQEQLAQAHNRERQMQADFASGNYDPFTDLEECIEALEEQMNSIKMQKETLEKPDGDEAFLKNELSLFLNVSSILPELADPKFSGTFVDKKRGVKQFKFSADEMSPFETCQAAWNMMRHIEGGRQQLRLDVEKQWTELSFLANLLKGP